MPGGRPRKPTALHRLHGTARPDRMNAAEPMPPILGDVQPPAWLKGRSLRAWRDLAPRLRAMRVLTEADRDALALLCDAYGELVECRQVIAREGRVYETDGQSVMTRTRPEVAIAADAWRRVNAM